MWIMQERTCVCLLTYMVAVAIPVSVSFNIETTNPRVHSGEQEDFYGYKVLQYMSDTTKGIIITAPLQNGSGGVCSSGQVSKCFSPQGVSLKNQTIPVKNFGLALAANSKLQFTVCSPSVAHECYGNSYLNSVCYKLTHTLEKVSVSSPSFQDCRKKSVDLVFLFDGSASMTGEEFNKNKVFIEDIINSLRNSSIQFAAVQFSSEYNKVFDFNDYRANASLNKLVAEPHMNALTNTHKAMKFVLEEILDNQTAGASPDATKVLVLITDGNPTDSDRWKIIQKYNEKNIIRFVIAVKAFQLEKYKNIASQPTEKYAFEIKNYDGLTEILGKFQKQIFKMEGTKISLAQDRTDEMSQSGFSAAAYNDTLVLGSVGSNNWRGSIQEKTSDDKKMTQIKDPNMQMDSYMGYSISVGEVKNTALYFAGAPRFEHIGQVVLFTRQSKIWTPTQRLNGDQIGSYFGAELCSVDIDSDSNTDFLLVGAPLFYHPQEKREGQINIYTLTDEVGTGVKLKSVLNVTVSSMGRFGTTIASITDLNGDGLRDVAVGAPLEDDGSGAVYIYLGNKQRGIRSFFNQRIAGREIKTGLRFFGQAIDGRIDMGKDDLPDLVIGSKGNVVVLRSMPVFNVIPHLSFQPEEIKIDKIECSHSRNEIQPMANLTVCFEMVETTKSKDAETSSRLNVSYVLDVDPMRQTHRGFFSRTNRKARSNADVYELRDRETCFNYTVYMLKCVEDRLTPVCIKLNFTQTDSENAPAKLNVDSKKVAMVEIPFEKPCGNSDQCVAELAVDFNFMTPTLVVAEESYFTISVKLSNLGNDSYNTSLTMHYPEGLSFSKMNLTEKTRPTVHLCYDQEDVLNKTVCGISLPVYRSKSSATFKAFFYILTSTSNRENDWDDTISMTIEGKSNNANTTRLSSMTKNISVQFEVKMAVTVKEDTVTYLNFTGEDSAPKKLEIIYNIANPGWKGFPVDVSLAFTTTQDFNFEMKNYKVSVEENKTQCTTVTSALCFSDEHFNVIKCDPFTLEKESTIEIKLTGDVQFKDLKEQAENMAFLKRYTGDGAGVTFQSFLQVNYDRTRYVLDTHTQQSKGFTQRRSNEVCPRRDGDPTFKWTRVKVEFVISMDRQLIIQTGVGLGLLLLIILTVIMYKMGCFKRRKLHEDEDEVRDGIQAGTSAPLISIFKSSPDKDTVGQSNTDSKSDQPSEKNQLLGNNEENSSNPLTDAKQEKS